MRKGQFCYNSLILCGDKALIKAHPNPAPNITGAKSNHN